MSAKTPSPQTTRRPRLVALGTGLLGAAFVWIGVDHFVHPETYIKIMPAYLPWHHELVLWSGAAEIAGGIGVWIPRVRRAAGWGLIALLVAVLPANAEDFRQSLATSGWSGATIARAIRLPVQLLIGWWIFACAIRRRRPG